MTDEARIVGAAVIAPAWCGRVFVAADFIRTVGIAFTSVKCVFLDYFSRVVFDCRVAMALRGVVRWDMVWFGGRGAHPGYIEAWDACYLVVFAGVFACVLDEMVGFHCWLAC